MPKLTSPLQQLTVAMAKSIILSGTSGVKLEALEELGFNVTGLKPVTKLAMAEQPINGAGLLGAYLRLYCLKQQTANPGKLVAIENSIIYTKNKCQECCDVVFKAEDDCVYTGYCIVELDRKRIEPCIKKVIEKSEDYEYQHYGWSTTVGSEVVKMYPGTKSDDWIYDFCLTGNPGLRDSGASMRKITRKEQIKIAVKMANKASFQSP